MPIASRPHHVRSNPHLLVRGPSQHPLRMHCRNRSPQTVAVARPLLRHRRRTSLHVEGGGAVRFMHRCGTIAPCLPRQPYRDCATALSAGKTATRKSRPIRKFGSIDALFMLAAAHDLAPKAYRGLSRTANNDSASAILSRTEFHILGSWTAVPGAGARGTNRCVGARANGSHAPSLRGCRGGQHRESKDCDNR
jgi:hypothetical protein